MKKHVFKIFITGLLIAWSLPVFAQDTGKINDANTPLYKLPPDYPVPYGIPQQKEVKAVMDKVYHYLSSSTPAMLVDSVTQKNISSFDVFDKNAVFKQGDFRLISYEWGVTYAAMLLAGKVTGDQRYTTYTSSRLQFIANCVDYFQSWQKNNPGVRTPVYTVLHPKALDNAGAMCAAMIKAEREGVNKNLKPEINRFIRYIMQGQYRLKDGTLARNRPQPNTLWLDDLFMSIPALAQMGKLTGDKKYYSEAVKQYKLYTGRMFNKEKGLFMHGWVQGMKVHPAFYWARANGWALLANEELLDVLPEDFNGRTFLLKILRQHIKGITSLQSGKGLWHQLLNRTDSYLETSASAIYTYALAHAINEGWIDAKAYAPAALLAWNALTTKINDKGQVEGTCVGTGMAFDPAFYYYRPVNVYAAHGYGPVIMAGAEIIKLLEHHTFEINDSAVQLVK